MSKIEFDSTTPIDGFQQVVLSMFMPGYSTFGLDYLHDAAHYESHTIKFYFKAVLAAIAITFAVIACAIMMSDRYTIAWLPLLIISGLLTLVAAIWNLVRMFVIHFGLFNTDVPFVRRREAILLSRFRLSTMALFYVLGISVAVGVAIRRAF